MKEKKSNTLAANSMLKIHMNMIETPKNKIEKLMVVQKCMNCAKHIKRTVLLVDGVIQVNWETDSGMLIVEYNSEKTSLEIIELALTDAGHDIPNFKGKNDYYNIKPECCLLSDQPR